MNAKNTNKSPIHENEGANITWDFGDGDISRFRSQLPHTRPHGQTATSITVRLQSDCDIKETNCYLAGSVYDVKHKKWMNYGNN